MPRESLLKYPAELRRAPHGGYPRAHFEFETMTAKCEERGVEYPVDDVERKLYADYLSADEWAVKLAADNILRSQEVSAKDVLFNATTFTSYTGGITNEWDDATNATPYADVLTAANTVLGNVAMPATHILMPYTVFRNVLKVDEITNRMQYTAPNQIMGLEAQRQLLVNYFGLDVIVAGAYYDSADEGQAASLSAIWGTEYAMVFRRSDGDLRSPGLGRTIFWTEDSPSNTVIEQYRDEEHRRDIFRARHHFIHKLFKVEYGYLMSNMTT
jgi:hypothetical protein